MAYKEVPRRSIVFVIIVCVFLLSLNTKPKFQTHHKKEMVMIDLVMKRDIDYTPLIESELKRKVEKYIESNNLEGKIAIHFESFEYDIIYEYNSEDYFIAASTYKLPIAMLCYEKIYNGEMSLNDYMLFSERHLENGGYIESSYYLGSYISVATLLYALIVYSDNSAGHMLYEKLGGWNAYKEQAKKYTTQELDYKYYSTSNYSNAKYMGEVLNYLYNNSYMFETLIAHMQIAQPNSFFNLHNHESVAQKYGQYGRALHSVGLANGSSPYSIVVFTRLGINGEEVLADINDIYYNYFNK